MIRGTEAGARIRAAIVDMKGKLNMTDWEGSSANVMGNVWMTDCDSLYEHLVSTKHNSVDNKRLNVDLMALRQLVWERGGERQEYVDHSRGDFPRWIDTSTMIADPLTKAMSCERLSKMLSTGILDLNPTEESLIIKAKSKLLRKRAKEAKKPKTDGVDEAPNTENEDSNVNVAWRANEDTENEMFNEGDFDTDAEDKDTELLEAMDKAMVFIKATNQIQKAKDSEVAKVKEIAKKNRQRKCGDCRGKLRSLGRINEVDANDNYKFQ